jgi:hypothetical protein
MPDTTTELDELTRQKDLIWDALLCCKYDTPEGKKIEEQYIDVCRKIRRIELAARGIK